MSHCGYSQVSMWVSKNILEWNKTCWAVSFLFLCFPAKDQYVFLVVLNPWHCWCSVGKSKWGILNKNHNLGNTAICRTSPLYLQVFSLFLFQHSNGFYAIYTIRNNYKCLQNFGFPSHFFLAWEVSWWMVRKVVEWMVRKVVEYPGNHNNKTSRYSSNQFITVYILEA